MKSFLNQNNLSRGLRNNNPMNLIYTSIPWNGKIPYAQNTDWSGTPSNVLKHFEQFVDANHGIRAGANDIISDVKEHGYSLTQLMHEYAPETENNVAAYINFIATATGLNPNTPITWNYLLLSEVIRAIISMENGAQMSALITDTDITDSINLLPQVILDQLGTFVAEHKKPIGAGLVVVGLGLLGFAGYKIYKAA